MKDQVLKLQCQGNAAEYLNFKLLGNKVFFFFFGLQRRRVQNKFNTWNDDDDDDDDRERYSG